jgi:Flp pilus assembly protein TadD
VKTGQFELALTPLTALARLSRDSPGLVVGTGLALLRMPLLPSEVPEARRDLVQKAGIAGTHDLAQRGEEAARAWAEVVAAYPTEPWVHYLRGVSLLRGGSDAGLAELRREIEVKPDNVMAYLEIAFELLVHGDNREAKAVAAKAVALAPALFAGHNALGRAMVELGEVQEGIRELEEAARLAPESPETHFALGRAYARAGRAEDAARERAAFARLDRERRERREQRERGGAVGPRERDESRP